MYTKLVRIYKTPLILSITLAITLTAVSVEREALPIAILFIGSILGTFVLDLDYFIQAFFIEPTTDFAKTLTSFVRHGDILNALSYINYNKDKIRERTLNSGLFQLILAAVAYFVVSASLSLFLKALVLSTFVNSIYRVVEEFHKDPNLNDWFWTLNVRLNKNGVMVYIGALTLVAIILISLF